MKNEEVVQSVKIAKNIPRIIKGIEF